jgi:hypothetical protein
MKRESTTGAVSGFFSDYGSVWTYDRFDLAGDILSSLLDVLFDVLLGAMN